MAKQKYYVVWKGRKPGIYASWDDCKAQVDGFPAAEYKAFDNKAAADAAYRGKYADYKSTKGHTSTTIVERQALISAGKIKVPSYAVDAACSGSPGPVEYRCVNVENGSEVFRQGPFDNGTNNIGEFLAIAHALADFSKKGISAPLYSDSRNAMLWIKAKKCRTNLPREKTSKELLDRIELAETWLRNNYYSNAIIKWETDEWGENPADFGRK